jgi:hypothetical protein
MNRSILVALAVTATVIALPGLADTIRFTKEMVGIAPLEFDLWRTGEGGPGRWEVVRDATADGGYAFEQQSQDRNDYRFPLAIYKPVSAKNMDVQIHFKAVSGRIDRAGGIAVRLTTPDDYYVVRANALEDNVRFYRVVRGKREQLASADVKVPSDQWHTLGLKAEGDRFTISFAGKTLYEVADKTFETTGKVALWTKADSVTRFDRLDIRALP